MLVTSSKHSRIIIGALVLVAVFLALRLPGIHLPYHQDEWKNVSAASTVEGAGNFYAHPPLMQMIFVADYKIFGMDNFRVLPLLFSIGTVALLYFVVKRRVGQAGGIWAVILASLCFYNILGSLQPDVDGAILPFLFLLAVYFYDRWQSLAGETSSGPIFDNDYEYSYFTKVKSWLWFALLALTLLVGFLFKLNFIIVVGVFVLDYLWNYRRDGIVKRIVTTAFLSAGFGLIYVGLLYLIQAVYPAFSISFMLGHANQYSGEGRDWTQIIVQGVKAIYYLSPLMLLPLLFVSKESLRRTRIFWVYLAVGFVFYFVLFDFSRAALDKYLMFAIIPLAAIVGSIFASVFEDYEIAANKRTIVLWSIVGTVVALGLVAANFLPQEVVALYPKTAWFSRVLHGHWNVLTPFNGGSGPLGFYMSFLFIAGPYISAAVFALVALFKRSWRPAAVLVILVIGIAYNGVFAEELFHGKINGSAPDLLAQTTAFIAQDKSISKVLTYNDIGAGPLSIMGKYAGRIYATPSAEEGYRKKFSEFDGQYMIIDIPRFDPAGFYYNFFAKCNILFQATSGQISGKVYDCPKQP